MRRSIYSPVWNRRFMDLALQVATWSKDPDCKVGAVIVNNRRIVATGYNGFPSGTQDNYLDCSTEEKIEKTIHAELNAIFNATDLGHVIYVTKDPCLECCKAIIQAGIMEIVLGRPEMGKWAASQQAGLLMLSDVNVHITRLF